MSGGSHELRSTFASLPRTTRGQPIVLGADPKGKNFLYVNGNSVFIRNIQDPSICDIYTQHSTQTTVAKYSPSGFYIASGDVSGKIRIWDTVNKEHILKNEFQPFAGKVCDISWSSDNQRLCIVGEGREKFGVVINAETGTSTGEISGQSKQINSCDFRQQRPFRIATASEDMTIAFFEGPPFKFKITKQDHTRFVNCIRYAPNGDYFLSGGADGKAFLYDGKTSDMIGALGDPQAHKGGIYGVAISPDSKHALTVSGDKSARIWNIESKQMVTEFVLGTAVEDMQVGCLWQGDTILSVSLSGHINYLSQNSPQAPIRIIKGHNKPITALAVSADKSRIFTGSMDGQIAYWDVATGDNNMMSGKGHSNQIQGFVVVGDQLVSCSMDDKLMYTSTTSNTYGTQLPLGSQPRHIAASGDIVIVACVKELVMCQGGKLFPTAAGFEPGCVAISPDLSEVAVGSMASKLHIFRIEGQSLVETKAIDYTGVPTDMAYSPDGSMLAVSDAQRKVTLFSIPGHEPLIRTEWVWHTAKVNSLSWTSDSSHIASGSLDTNIVIWDPQKKMTYKIMKGVHPMSQVTGVAWLDDNSLVSTGQDGCVKIWNIEH